MPRLLIFETPGEAQLEEKLDGLFPEIELVTRTTPSLIAGEPNREALSVWHISWNEAELEEKASDLLRNLIYPLSVRRCPFVISFEANVEAFQPAALTKSELGKLDLEDILKLLAPDSAQVQQFDHLHLLESQVPQTPIEEALSAALQEKGIDAQPQARVGRFIVDFLVNRGGQRWAIEADGQAFHDPHEDALRDRELAELGIKEVVRFTGSEIFRDALACARRVDAITSGRAHERDGIRSQTLDDSQEQAAHHSIGAARVLAPAGAGKTRVLVERIAELVRAGAEPSSILALAFNKKANDQLVARLDELGVPTSSGRLFDPTINGVRCATFHAFGYRFQREHLGLNFEVEGSKGEWRGLMEAAARKSGFTLKGLKRGSNPIGELLRARERACADLVDPYEIEIEFEKFGDQPSEMVAYGPIDSEFERVRVERQIQSYDDMITTTVDQLLHSPKAREFVQEYFTHILVDEYQDLNAAQLAVVDIVSRPTRDLFVVGDDDQLIYGWRYAKVTNILEFEKRVPSAETYVLSTNYRSSVSVVQSSRRLIDHNEVRVAKDIRPRDGAPAGEVRYINSASLSDRTEQVTAFIATAKERSKEWRKIAVLCRYKSQQPMVALALDRAGIPRTPLLSYRLFSDPHMKLVRSYIQLIRDPESLDGDTLASVINRPNRFATNELLELLRASPAPWTDFNSFLIASEDDEYRTKALRGFRDRVQLLQIFSGEGVGAEQMIDNIVKDFDLERFWRDEKPNSLRDQDEATPLDLLDLIRIHAREAADVDSFLASWHQREDNELGDTDSAADNLAREDTPEQDRVVIGTMHASKGREYEAVVIFDYVAELSELSDQEIEEERRVFYVGMTRAQDSLLITTDSSKPLHRFVRESIAPPEPKERLGIETRQIELDDERRRAAIDLAHARERLIEIADGRALARLEHDLAQAREIETQMKRKLADLGQQLDESGIWAAITGRKERTKQAVLALEEELETLEPTTNLSDDVTLLRADPKRYEEPLRRVVLQAEDLLSDLDREDRSLTDRLNQLKWA